MTGPATTGDPDHSRTGDEPGYVLLDAGDGRRLERFGPLVLDRPAPAAAGLARRDPGAWASAAARYERAPGAATGGWEPAGSLPERWTTVLDGLAVELRPTPAGQVGLFPEHLPVARWAASRAARLPSIAGRPPSVLNLFAYTGLATLVLARAGSAVAHVDASRPAVAWARRNAELAGLAERPIRWLVEDATRFALREGRRGRRYDGVVLDPPTYGHGPRGAPWRLESDLEGLLAAIAPLLEPSGWFLAGTAHAAGLGPASLEDPVRAVLGERATELETRELALEGARGLRLPAGWAVLAAGGESPR